MRSILRQLIGRRSVVVCREKAVFSVVESENSWRIHHLHRAFSSAVAVPVDDDIQDKPFRRFQDLNLHEKSLKALQMQRLDQLTEIQESTFDVIISGRDVVGRARTGTGKTLSFLLPSLERVVRKAELGKLPAGVSILILSPTRELAAQISKEADRLVAQHSKAITSQVIFGGSSRREDIKQFERRLPTVLVATPGRLKDHLASTKLHGNNPFVAALQNLQILVLDETDRLLDMGFRRDVQHIISRLPQQRQTLLFSATLPQDVREVVQLATKPDYELVDCIQDEDPATQTNIATDQSYVILPTDQFWTKTIEYLLELTDQGGNKIMVFFPMTSMVEMYAQLFNSRFGRRVLELHGKMQQRERTTVSRRFRNSKRGILFTSDVSARGVDYPDVTHVVQIGACESRETYIHRLGRTGRAGKKGKGILILPDLESVFLKELDGLEIPRNDDLTERLASRPPSKKLMNELGPVVQKIRAGRDPKLQKSVHDAYQAMISYYFQKCDDKHQAISHVNRLADVMGLTELPAIGKTRAKRMNILSMPGVNIQSNWNDHDWQSGWGQTGSSSKAIGHKHGRDRGFVAPAPQSGRRGHQSGHQSSKDTFWDRTENRQVERRERRAQQFKDAFSKVGPKKDSAFGNQSASTKKRNSFQRWETKGNFTFKG